jgi:hypothetical protein
VGEDEEEGFEGDGMGGGHRRGKLSFPLMCPTPRASPSGNRVSLFCVRQCTVDDSVTNVTLGTLAIFLERGLTLERG